MIQERTASTPLFAHQEDAVQFLLKHGGSGLIAHEPGLGKTRMALEFFHRLRAGDRDYPNLHMLVVAPISLLEAAWHEDLMRFTPHLSFWNLHKNGVADIPHANVYAINYEFFQRTDNIVKFWSFLVKRRWLAVLDESSKIKNHAASQTKNMLKLSKLFQYRVAMSGTPAPNSEAEYWSQIFFASPHVLPKSFNQFRRTYFYLRGRSGQPIAEPAVPTRQAMYDLFSKQGAQYAITPQKREELFSVIGPYIHARRKEDCLDLPDQVDEKRLVKMGPNQARAYRQMKNQLVAEIQGQDVVAQVALVKLMKLREITSGFAFSEDGTLVETECPKMDALQEILDELGDKQAIIWCNFTWEVKKVIDFLTHRSAEASKQKQCDGGLRDRVFEFYTADLYGGTQDREASIAAFLGYRNVVVGHEGLNPIFQKEAVMQARYLVANPHSAAHGLTFVNCSNQIFFSLDYSWEAYEQARARTHRAGQVNKCTYFHILAEGTIDEEILGVLRRKGSAQEIVFKLRGEK